MYRNLLLVWLASDLLWASQSSCSSRSNQTHLQTQHIVLASSIAQYQELVAAHFTPFIHISTTVYSQVFLDMAEWTGKMYSTNLLKVWYKDVTRQHRILTWVILIQSLTISLWQGETPATLTLGNTSVWHAKLSSFMTSTIQIGFIRSYPHVEAHYISSVNTNVLAFYTVGNYVCEDDWIACWEELFCSFNDVYIAVNDGSNDESS